MEALPEIEMDTSGSNLAWESYNEKRGKGLMPSNHNLGPVGICLVASRRLNPYQHVLQLFPFSGLRHPTAQKEVSTGRLAHRDLDIMYFFPLPLLGCVELYCSGPAWSLGGFGALGDDWF